MSVGSRGNRSPKLWARLLQVLTIPVEFILIIMWLYTVVVQSEFIARWTGLGTNTKFGTLTTAAANYNPGSGGSGLILRTGCTAPTKKPIVLKPANVTNPSEGMSKDMTYWSIFAGVLVVFGIASVLIIIRSGLYFLVKHHGRRFRIFIRQRCCGQSSSSVDGHHEGHDDSGASNGQCDSCHTFYGALQYPNLCYMCGLGFCNSCFSTGKRSLPNGQTVQVCEDCLSVPCPEFLRVPMAGMIDEFTDSFAQSLVIFCNEAVATGRSRTSNPQGMQATVVGSLVEEWMRILGSVHDGAIPDPSSPGALEALFANDEFKLARAKNQDVPAQLDVYAEPSETQSELFCSFHTDLANALGGFWDRNEDALNVAAMHFFVAMGMRTMRKLVVLAKDTGTMVEARERQNSEGGGVGGSVAETKEVVSTRDHYGGQRPSASTRSKIAGLVGHAEDHYDDNSLQGLLLGLKRLVAADTDGVSLANLEARFASYVGETAEATAEAAKSFDEASSFLSLKGGRKTKKAGKALREHIGAVSMGLAKWAQEVVPSTVDETHATLGRRWVGVMDSVLDSDQCSKDSQLKTLKDCLQIYDKSTCTTKSLRNVNSIWSQVVLRVPECTMGPLNPAGTARDRAGWAHGRAAFCGDYSWLPLPRPIPVPAEWERLHGDAAVWGGSKRSNRMLQDMATMSDDDRAALLAAMLGADETRTMQEARNKGLGAVNDPRHRMLLKPGCFVRIPAAAAFSNPRIVLEDVCVTIDSHQTMNVDMVSKTGCLLVLFDDALAVFERAGQAGGNRMPMSESKSGESGKQRQKSGDLRKQKSKSAMNKGVAEAATRGLEEVHNADLTVGADPFDDYELVISVLVPLLKNVRKKKFGLEIKTVPDATISIFKQKGDIQKQQNIDGEASLLGYSDHQNAEPFTGGSFVCGSAMRDESQQDLWSELMANITLLQLGARLNRYESMSPNRHGNRARLVVEGAEHMAMVADAISAAKDVIFIADWWLHPNCMLKRAPTGSPQAKQWMLSNLLLRKAEEGVHIYVMLFKDPPVISLDSDGAVKALNAMHPNIEALRHGPKLNKIFYSHHMKFVVVDHALAFVGGVDLTSGRWDTEDHPLADDRMPYTCAGMDYYNPEKGEIDDKAYKSQATDIPSIDRNSTPRMPWHDISCVVAGRAAMDVSMTFIQRWVKHKNSPGGAEMNIHMVPAPRRRIDPADRASVTSGSDVNAPRGSFTAEGKAAQEGGRRCNELEGAPEGGVHTRGHNGCHIGTPYPVWKFFGGFDNAEVQVLRSQATWSGGTRIDNSIYRAYLDQIKNSKHLIYIENQVSRRWVAWESRVNKE